MKELRAKSRIPSQITAECAIGAGTRYYPCLITDVSPKGLGIMCSAQTTVRSGAQLLLRIYLTCGPVLVRGRITWVRMLTRRRCLWAAGSAITLIDQAHRMALIETALRKDDSEALREAHFHF